MEEERLMLHASLLPSAPHRATTTPSIYVPPVALYWLNTLEAKEMRLCAKGDRLVAVIRAQLRSATTAALYGIYCESEGYRWVNALSALYPSMVGWAVFSLGILILLPYIILFRIKHGEYIRFFSRPMSDLLREGDTLLDQTLSIRNYVRRTPISSVALSSPMDDIVRFDTRIEALIRRFRRDVRYLRFHRMFYIIVLVFVCAMGFMLAVVGPWWMYVHAEVLFGN